MIRFEVPGDAVGKGRARATSRGGMTRLYTPAKTVNYESLIAIFGSQAMAGRAPLEGPVSLALAINVSVPASWSARKRAAALAQEIHPTKKPDADNVLKAFGDGLNGVVWKDDVQIVSVSIRKRYALVPSVEVMAGDA